MGMVDPGGSNPGRRNREEGSMDAFQVFAIDAGAEHMEPLHESNVIHRLLLTGKFTHRHRIFCMSRGREEDARLIGAYQFCIEHGPGK